MKGLVAGIDVGGSSVKAWVASLDGELRSVAREPVSTLRPEPFVAEFDPDDWWASIRLALRQAVADAGRPGADYVGLTASSLRQGFVLIDGDHEVGNAILNSDRRGADQLERLAQLVDPDALYELTGHWLAPELTLPKLMHLREAEPARWQGFRLILFVHDWVLWRLTGVAVTEPSLACAGQMADIRGRTWACDLLDDLGVEPDRLAPLVEPGTVVGELKAQDLGLPCGLPVCSGGADTQMVATGAGGLQPGAVCVAAGSTTPVQLATSAVPKDPLRHPWVSTHLRGDLWAVETNAGYAGMLFDWLASITGRPAADLLCEIAESPRGARGLSAFVGSPVWSAERWMRKAACAAIGFTQAHSIADLARAFVEGHAYSVRANIEDLERAVSAALNPVILTGGAAKAQTFCQLLADVLGRNIQVPETVEPSALAGVELVARAVGLEAEVDDHRRFSQWEPKDRDGYDDAYQRFLDMNDTLAVHFPREAS